MKVETNNMIAFGLQENYRLAEEYAFVDDGPLFSFSGAAAVGQASNVYKNLDAASPLQVVQVLPMELATRDSCFSMPTICVRNLGHWFVDEVTSVEHSIWLGTSLGVVVASEAALLCETALAPTRAIVALDNRTGFPM